MTDFRYADYQIAFGRTIDELLKDMKRWLNNNYKPHGSLLYVTESDKPKHSTDISMEEVSRENDIINKFKIGFYQPMFKEKD